MKDPIGQALYDHYSSGFAKTVQIDSNYTEDESIDTSYFFRKENELPLIEKQALNLCRGKILDIGAGAGCHSKILQNKGFDITAIDISSFSCKVMKSTGINKVINSNLYELPETYYDTLLLLMNGTGLAGDLLGLKPLFEKLKKLLTKGGQILIDSSDIKYLFTEDDGSYWIDLSSINYYGEMIYTAKYNQIISEPFKWLFIDFEKLNIIANECGFACKKIGEGDHFEYLAQLTL
jgi:hypothetical protein